MAEYEWAARERGWAALLATAMLGALLYPLRQYRRPRCERTDGFPLSYYPMFSTRRGETKRIKYVIAVRPDGSRGYVHYRHLGPGGLNQVRRQLGRVHDEDRVPAWTVALATRLAAKDAMRDVVRIEVIEGVFDLDNCLLEHQLRVKEETVLGSAELPRARSDSRGRPSEQNVATESSQVSEMPEISEVPTIVTSATGAAVFVTPTSGRTGTDAVGPRAVLT